MTALARQLAACVHQRIVEENVVVYKELFIKTPIEAATDPYWKDALALFAELDDGQRDKLFRLVRQVAVDTTSAVLGIFGGTHITKDLPEDIHILVGRESVESELQDEFLEIEETQSHKG
jgi:hypothetical protein